MSISRRTMLQMFGAAGVSAGCGVSLANDSIERSIPLTEVYGTVSTIGKIEIDVGVRTSTDARGAKVEEYNTIAGEYLTALVWERKYENNYRGPSTILMVAADDIDRAVAETAHALIGKWRAIPKKPPKSQWLAVYLGLEGVVEPRWAIDNITLSGTVVRVSYKRIPEAGFCSFVFQSYYAWAPLGTLARGAYKLELYDLDVKDVVLMRRVEVV